MTAGKSKMHFNRVSLLITAPRQLIFHGSALDNNVLIYVLLWFSENELSILRSSLEIEEYFPIPWMLHYDMV